MSRRRVKLSREAEALILVQSRRRCCICFALNRDAEIKSGQIAHIDRNAANAAPDNLVFLCLLHHDQYDSRTRQSKGLTKTELLRFRSELRDALERAWREPVRFGAVEVSSRDLFEGRYVRKGEFEFAELQVRRQSSDVVHVAGLALSGTNRECPRSGVLDFQAHLVENKVVFVDDSEHQRYRLELTFLRDAIVAHEESWGGYHGMGVTFEGVYDPAAPV